MYVFAKNINGTKQTGIIDVSQTPPKLICLCDEDQSKIILEKMNVNSKVVEALKEAAEVATASVVYGRTLGDSNIHAYYPVGVKVDTESILNLIEKYK